MDCLARASTALKDNKHSAKYQVIMDNWHELALEAMRTERVDERFAILSHLDTWTNNTMFQFDSQSTDAVDVSILDWQCAQYNTPAMDLLFYLATSTDKDIRRDHWHALIDVYYATFCKTLTTLGSDPQKLFTFEDLQADLRRLAPLVFIYTPVIYTELLAHDHDFVEGSDTEIFAVSVDDSTVQAFTKRVNDIADDFVEFGYIS